MNTEFYEAIRPVRTKEAPVKKQRGLFNWLDRHPRMILPFVGGAWLLLFGSAVTVILL